MEIEILKKAYKNKYSHIDTLKKLDEIINDNLTTATENCRRLKELAEEIKFHKTYKTNLVEVPVAQVEVQIDDHHEVKQGFFRRLFCCLRK